jgi:hypothetical protein
MKKTKPTAHYVNNVEFLAAMIEFRNLVLSSKEKDSPRPKMPDYIGECFVKIATHLSYKPNFINYTFREDMISDGVENCLQYVDNFDPEKSENPFAYFTQIIYYAFLRRIQKEKKQLYIKYKAMERAGVLEYSEPNSTGRQTIIPGTALYSNIQDFIYAYEEKQDSIKAKTKKKLVSNKKQGSLEKFIKKDQL